MHTYTHARAHGHTHTYTHTHVYTPPIHTHTNTHTHTHTHTYTHTHTHTHTSMLQSSNQPVPNAPSQHCALTQQLALIPAPASHRWAFGYALNSSATVLPVNVDTSTATASSTHAAKGGLAASVIVAFVSACTLFVVRKRMISDSAYESLNNP